MEEQNCEMFPWSQCYLPALATDHPRLHVEIINLISPELLVEHASLTLISRQQTDTSKGLCYIMRACDMFKTIHERAYISTLWCFVCAKEELFQPARTFDVKIIFKMKELQYYL